jgi:predicted amidohydrolase/NH3-dependent NAD+ synthetase
MKVAVAQINPTVGDIQGNAEKMVQYAGKAKEMGCDLVVFPEAALTGSPVGDLVLRPGFVETGVAALGDLAKRLESIPAVVGFIDKNPLPEGKPYYNGAAILEAGQIQYITYKSNLPRNDYFDQTRSFEPAGGISPVKFKEKRIAITIGEDLWDDAVTGLALGFSRPLLGDIAKKKVELVICISAFPYALGLDRKRVEILKKHAATYKLPIILCNQVGACGDIVFDGSSVCVSAGGEVIAQGKAFQEDLIQVDLVYGAGDIHEEERPANELLYRAAVLGIRDYAAKCGFKQAAVALTGTAASAVTACAAVEALGRENVVGVVLNGAPEDAKQLATALGVRLETLEPVQRTSDSDLAARLANAALASFARKQGSLTVSSITRSEILVGDATLDGEIASAIAPLGDLPHSTVCAIAQEVVNRDKPVIPPSILNRGPNDASVDPVLAQVLGEAQGEPDAADPVVRRMEAAEIHRRARPLALRVYSNLLRPARQMPIARKR